MYYHPLRIDTPFRLRTICIALGTLLILCALLGYILYQARFLLTGPQVTVEHTPFEHASERAVTIEGTAQNIARISLNGRQIYTNPEGIFTEMIVLTEGYNLVTIAATDRYGRTTQVVQEYVYQSPSLVQ